MLNLLIPKHLWIIKIIFLISNAIELNILIGSAFALLPKHNLALRRKNKYRKYMLQNTQPHIGTSIFVTLVHIDGADYFISPDNWTSSSPRSIPNSSISVLILGNNFSDGLTPAIKRLRKKSCARVWLRDVSFLYQLINTLNFWI